jgi:hypothetical protein
MEFRPGDFVLLYGETACLVNTQAEAPVLENWLLASSNRSGPGLAERLAAAQDEHSRSTKQGIELSIDACEAQTIRDALEANRRRINDFPGLVNLWNTLSTLEP